MAYRRKAILSDIHGNLEAILRVKADVAIKNMPGKGGEEKPPIEEFYCLGDIFGYGADQIACWDIAKLFDLNLNGNHEKFTRNKLEDKELILEESALGVSHSASIAMDYLAEQLLGRKEIQSILTGRNIILPEEDIKDLKKEAYPRLHTEFLAKQAGITVDSKEALEFGLKDWWNQTLPQETQQKIGELFFTQVLAERPTLLETYFRRLERRAKVLEIYNFVNQKKYSHQEGNALYVHDDPLKPGSGKYCVDEETAKTADLSDKPKSDFVDISQITRERFPGIDYIFVGHSHVLPGIFEINGIKLVYVGSVGIPRKDNKKQRYACYTEITVDENNNIVDVVRGKLVYKWQVPQQKMIDAMLVDKFTEMLKKRGGI